MFLDKLRFWEEHKGTEHSHTLPCVFPTAAPQSIDRHLPSAFPTAAPQRIYRHLPQYSNKDLKPTHTVAWSETQTEHRMLPHAEAWYLPISCVLWHSNFGAWHVAVFRRVNYCPTKGFRNWLHSSVYIHTVNVFIKHQKPNKITYQLF